MNYMLLQPFHVSFPVESTEKAFDFYISLLFSEVIVRKKNFLAVNFLGHYLAFHETEKKMLLENFLTDTTDLQFDEYTSLIPSFHIGLMLDKFMWEKYNNIFNNSGVAFIVKPLVRNKKEKNEFGFMMLKDFNGIPIEFQYEIGAEEYIISPQVHNQAKL